MVEKTGKSKFFYLLNLVIENLEREAFKALRETFHEIHEIKNDLIVLEIKLESQKGVEVRVGKYVVRDLDVLDIREEKGIRFDQSYHVVSGAFP